MFQFLLGLWLGWHIEAIQLKVAVLIEKVRQWL